MIFLTWFLLQHIFKKNNKRGGNLACNSYCVYRECCNWLVEGRCKSCLGVLFQFCFWASDGRIFVWVIPNHFKMIGRQELFPRSKKQF